MTQKMRTDLERMVEALEAQKRAVDVVLAPLKEALKNLRNQPDLDDLRAEAARIANGGHLPKRRPRTSTQFDRIAAFLVAENNEPKTMRELAEGSECNANSLASILYKTHKNLFECRKKEGFKNRLLWSLTPQAYASAQQSQ